MNGILPMKIDNNKVLVIDEEGNVTKPEPKPDYSGLGHRGENESYEDYKIRRHEEKMDAKYRGKWVHVAKIVRDDPKDEEHKFIDGDGTYRKDVSKDK